MMVYRWQGQDGPPRHTCLSWRTHTTLVHPHPPRHTSWTCVRRPPRWPPPPPCSPLSRPASDELRLLKAPPPPRPGDYLPPAWRCAIARQRGDHKEAADRVAASLPLSQSNETQYQCSGRCAKTIKNHANSCWLLESQGLSLLYPERCHF